MKPKIDAKDSQPIVEKLSHWYALNYRELPWRTTRDPYFIWLSEIILQQTRVQQGMPYYLRFSEAYDSIEAFANTPLDDILKLWQGLGYYSRARNMHKCANQIMENYDGTFPNSYKELLNLVGVGKYTAAAIASISFDEAVPAVDGNAYRVYSRLFDIEEDIAKASSFKTFFDLGKELMIDSEPGTFNQAVMELGATICTPKNPKCMECPIDAHCLAKEKKKQEQLPVKSKTVKVKPRFMDYIVFCHRAQVLVHQRGPKDIWQGLYDFHLVESNLKSKNRIFEFLKEHSLEDGALIYRSEEYKHVLTHQRLFIHFNLIEIAERQDFEVFCQNYKLKVVDISDMSSLAVPKPIEQFLQEELVNHIKFPS